MGKLTLGRSRDNDLVFPSDSFPSVSGHHALLEVVGPGSEEEGLWIEDLGSSNGTLVNGESVERVQLRLGDVIQLGSIGPRFAVISNEPLSKTLFVDPRSVRKAAGNLSEEKVKQIVERRAHRTFLRIGVLVTLLAVLLILWAKGLLLSSSEEMSASLEETSAAMRAQDQKIDAEFQQAREVIDKLRARDEARTREFEGRERERVALNQALRERVAERESSARDLGARLGALEGEPDRGEEIAHLTELIRETQVELEDARSQLASFNPVNLEQTRLSGVAGVRRTVVLLEVELALMNEQSGELLYISSEGNPNFEGNGRPWIRESSGSGFCLSEEGYILTNAHVAAPNVRDLLWTPSNLPITAQATLYAVFSGTSERYHARVVKVADNHIDLALVKIEPFEGMPHLEGFHLDHPPPEPGGDLYLLGFPLGNFALQEGRTVIASTFRGILSRIVDGSLQVDAGVHPGNSGGPITDPLGNVIGVVTSVQATPEQTAVYTIGYGIPIGDAESLWPPTTETDPVEEPGDKGAAPTEGEASGGD